MGKTGGGRSGSRVEKLADELGVPVEDVVARLKEQGVIPRSGSGLVTARVAQWVRDSYRAGDGSQMPRLQMPGSLGAISAAGVEQPSSFPATKPSSSPAKNNERRKRRGRATGRSNRHRLGIPVVSKDQAARPEPRKRVVDPEKVRKRVQELLGTPEPRRSKAPAEKRIENRDQVSGSGKVAGGRAQPKKSRRTPSGPKSWTCPNCVKRVDVDVSGTELVEHPNAKGVRCAGSGFPLPQRSEDALDYRVAGSYEGGRR